MSATIIGGSGQAGHQLVRYPSYPRKNRNSKNMWELTDKWWCLASLALSLAPADGAAPDDTDHSTLDCMELFIEPTPNAPTMVDVTAVYRYPTRTGNARAFRDGDDVKESQVVSREVGIDSKEAIATVKEADRALKKSQGAKTVTIWTVVYSFTEYLSSFTWSEANLIDNLNEVEAPDGVTNPTANKWRRTEMSVRESGNSLRVKRRSWMYNAADWEDVP